jgi:TolB protein
MSDLDGDWDIYLTDASGSRVLNLTTNQDDDIHPAWSPDGRQIAFSSNRDGAWEVYAMGADGSRPRRLTNDPVYSGNPVWSANGEHIAYVFGRDSDQDIYLVSAQGGESQPVINNPNAADYSPTWSPQDDILAYVSNWEGEPEIYVVEISCMDDGPAACISNSQNITNNPNTGDLDPAWSPDGTRLAYVTGTSGNSEIYVFDFDSGALDPITSSRADDRFPTWANPDA